MISPNSTAAALMNGMHNGNGNQPNGFDPFANLPADIARYTSHEFISRTYRIMADGQPLMLINEKFPVEQG